MLLHMWTKLYAIKDTALCKQTVHGSTPWFERAGEAATRGSRHRSTTFFSGISFLLIELEARRRDKYVH